MHIAGTYNGTNLKLYVNGRLVKSAVSAGAGLYAPSGAYNFSASGETFNGKLDETRLWNYVRTETQIRENMYHPLTGGETGLLNYWQFNAGSGTTVLDIAGGCNGTMNSMTDASWTGSGIPFGTGSAYSAVEAPGGVDFPGVDLSANYTVQHGAQVTAAVIRGQSLPIIAEDVVFDSQYWILDNFGSLGFVTSLTFHPVEDLSGYANITGEFRLYHRASTSGGAFTLYRAGANLNAAANTVTFGNVDTDGQFVIAYNEPDFLAAPQNVQIVVNGNTVHLSWDAVPNANVYNVYASDDPYAPQAVWRILALRHPATTWDVPIEAQAEFYKVVASDAGVVLE